MKRLDLYKPVAAKTFGKRCDKIASQIKECFSQELMKGDIPVMVTITHVSLSADLRNAKVFVVPFGGIGDINSAIECLESNKHFFKNLIAKKMRMKYIPDIIFKEDDTFEYSKRIENLLNGGAT